MTNNPSELRALRDAAFAALNGGDYGGRVTGSRVSLPPARPTPPSGSACR